MSIKSIDVCFFVRIVLFASCNNGIIYSTPYTECRSHVWHMLHCFVIKIIVQCTYVMLSCKAFEELTKCHVVQSLTTCCVQWIFLAYLAENNWVGNVSLYNCIFYLELVQDKHISYIFHLLFEAWRFIIRKIIAVTNNLVEKSPLLRLLVYVKITVVNADSALNMIYEFHWIHHNLCRYYLEETCVERIRHRFAFMSFWTGVSFILGIWNVR